MGNVIQCYYYYFFIINFVLISFSVVAAVRRLGAPEDIATQQVRCDQSLGTEILIRLPID